MKNLKIAICGLIIVIVLITIALVYVSNQKKDEVGVKDLPDDSIPQDTIENLTGELEKETNDYKFFAIDDFVNKFLHYVSNNNTVAINAMLDTTYEGEYNIQNLTNNVNKFYSQTMYKQEKQDYAVYYINGYIDLLNETEEYLTDDYYEVWIDNKNMSASIMPLTNEQYNQYITSARILEKKNIKSNEFNKYDEQALSNWELAQKYLEDYIFKATYNIELAYNILDATYREKKFFNDIKNFENYILANIQRTGDLEIVNCTTNIKEQSIEYTITDTNNNNYIIERKNAMDYTIMLDNQTI